MAEGVDAVVVAKVASIERSIARAREEFAAAGGAFATDRTRQDAATLNVQRACETAIDLAQHVVRVRRLGAVDSARALFALLADAGMLDAQVADAMQRMVGFRNIAVHEYQRLDLSILSAIITQRLDDVSAFAAALLRQAG